MSGVPSRQARLAHAAKHAELWNAGQREDWIASWRTIVPAEVRMFDPVGTEEKHGFDTATGDAYDMFQSILKIKMITVQVNGNEMAWVCENSLRHRTERSKGLQHRDIRVGRRRESAHQDLLPDARKCGLRRRPLRTPS